MTPLFIRSDVVKLQASFSENKRSSALYKYTDLNALA